jgi:hypothetical protein
VRAYKHRFLFGSADEEGSDNGLLQDVKIHYPALLEKLFEKIDVTGIYSQGI